MSHLLDRLQISFQKYLLRKKLTKEYVQRQQNQTNEKFTQKIDSDGNSKKTYYYKKSKEDIIHLSKATDIKYREVFWQIFLDIIKKDRYSLISDKFESAKINYKIFKVYYLLTTSNNDQIGFDIDNKKFVRSREDLIWHIHLFEDISENFKDVFKNLLNAFESDISFEGGLEKEFYGELYNEILIKIPKNKITLPR